jgi:hypothetical protein
MADNEQTLPDPADGDFEDWFELYNPGAALADISGFLLSDSTTEPGRFVIPAGTVIPAHGYLIVWADGEPEQNQPGGHLHADFRLAAEGEVIRLSAPNGDLLDVVSFAQQAPDISEGRWPDGAGAPFFPLMRPTPGAPNLGTGLVRLGQIATTPEGQILLSWSSAAGQQFRIQFKDDLNNPEWMELGETIVASGPQTSVALDVPSPSAHRFFRLRLVQ